MSEEQPEAKVPIELSVLEQRVAELGCLYGIEKLVSSEGQTTEVVLQAVARYLPNVSRQAGACSARLRTGTEEYLSDDFVESPRRKVFPIRIKGRDIGEVEIYGPATGESDEFLTESEEDLLVTIADRVGHFLDHWKMEQDLRNSTEQLIQDVLERRKAEAQLAEELKKFQIFHELAMAMAGHQHLEENLQLIADKSRELLNTETALIALHEDGNGALRLHTLSGLHAVNFQSTLLPPLGGLPRTGGRIDAAREAGFFREEGLLSGLAAPLQIGATRLGALYVFNRRPTPFTQQDIETLTLIGSLAAIELTNKRAQAELEATTQTLRSQYKNMPVPTFTWKWEKQDFVLADYNDAALEMTKGWVADMIGHSLLDLFPDVPEIKHDVTQCFQEKATVRRDLQFLMKNTGERKFLSVVCVFIPPDRVMMHTDDITERQRSEALLQAVLNLSASIAGCQTQDEICRQVIEGIRTQMDVDRCGLFLSDPQDPRFRGTYGTDMQGNTADEHLYFWDIRKERDIEDLFAGKSFMTGFPLGNPDPLPGEEGVCSNLIALRQGGQVFGIISVDNRISRRPVYESQMYHISMLAEVLGNALQIAGARADLRASMEKLKQANEELAAFNQVMVGRENRMIDLKEEINQLLAEKGLPPRYPPVWTETGARTDDVMSI